MGKSEAQHTDTQINEYYTELCRYTTLSTPQRKLSVCYNSSDRLSVYIDYLCECSSYVFRWYLPAVSSGSLGSSSAIGGRLEGVYCFDGRVWSQVDEVRLKVALKSFCTVKIGMQAQEWLRWSDKFLQTVKDGAMLSPLGVSRHIVGFGNGVYDFSGLSAGVVDASRPMSCYAVYHPFRERMPVISVLGYDYDMSSTCPLWESFLSSVLDTRQRVLLQKFLGLGMVERYKMPWKVENSLWLIGPGGAGKSTIMNVVRHVYGDESISSVGLGSLLSGGGENRARFLALAAGKVFNYCGEIQMEDMTRYGDAFKSLCSGEPQPIRRLGSNVEMCYEIPYLIFNMNRKPRSRNIDGAITRRLLFITFRSAVREEDRDPELENKLKAEASGIRNWMLEGYRQFVHDGCRLESTDKSVEETDSWLVENGQTVELFMRKMGCRAYAYTNEHEAGQWFPVRVLFDRYEKWCDKWGYESDCDLNGMGRELRRIGYKSKRVSAGIVYQVYGGENIV